MISSFYEGRVRLRHPALKDPGTAEGVVSMLGMYPGVQEVKSNPLTGSLLVLYDPTAISPEDLALAAKMLEENLGPAESGAGGSRSRLLRLLPGRNETRLLNGSLALCLAGLLVSRRLHAWAGGAFTLLALAHLLRHR